jgi:hypothetical protein
VADRYAEPGDPDLDLDVSGVRLRAVVAEGAEVLLLLSGGGGRLRDADTGLMTDVDSVEGDARVQCEPGDEDAGWFRFLVGRLEGWRDRGTELRMCGAPGKATVLIEDRRTWVPLPRRVHPDWV